MRLPFDHDQFLDVFAAFNTAWWPATVALWLLTALVLGTMAVRRADGRVVAALLLYLLAPDVLQHRRVAQPAPGGTP